MFILKLSLKETILIRKIFSQVANKARTVRPEMADLVIILASRVTYKALQVDAERQCLSNFFS